MMQTSMGIDFYFIWYLCLIHIMYPCVCEASGPQSMKLISACKSIHHEEAVTVDDSYCYSETAGT